MENQINNKLPTIGSLVKLIIAGSFIASVSYNYAYFFALDLSFKADASFYIGYYKYRVNLVTHNCYWYCYSIFNRVGAQIY